MTLLEGSALFETAARGCVFVSQGAAPPRGWQLTFRAIDDRLWATSYRDSAKTRAIGAADRAACLLFADDDDPLPYVVVEGRPELVEPTPELVARWTGIAVEDLTGAAASRVVDRLLRGKRLFVTVVPDRRPLVFDRG